MDFNSATWPRLIAYSLDEKYASNRLTHLEERGSVESGNLMIYRRVNGRLRVEYFING